jgi:hypothetical protein
LWVGGTHSAKQRQAGAVLAGVGSGIGLSLGRDVGEF